MLKAIDVDTNIDIGQNLREENIDQEAATRPEAHELPPKAEYRAHREYSQRVAAKPRQVMDHWAYPWRNQAVDRLEGQEHPEEVDQACR